MINKGGQKPGPQRGNRRRFPYEPRVIGGKLMMPAELQRIHAIVLDAAEVEIVSDEMRALGGRRSRRQAAACFARRAAGGRSDARPDRYQSLASRHDLNFIGSMSGPVTTKWSRRRDVRRN